MILLFSYSAGVGRTGTFLAMWQAIKEAVATGEVSICDYVIKMRQSRYLMVQNYVSTHIIIIECINMYSENVSLRRRIRNQTSIIGISVYTQTEAILCKFRRIIMSE